MGAHVERRRWKDRGAANGILDSGVAGLDLACCHQPRDLPELLCALVGAACDLRVPQEAQDFL